MDRRRFLAGLALVPALSALGGCGSTAAEQSFIGSERLGRGGAVAVLPFENLTQYPSAGVIAAELVATRLYAMGLFNVVETTRVRHQLQLDKVDPERLSESTTAQKIGARLNVEAVLIGSVSEYGYQHGLREEPVVGLNARLVRALDGRVLWAVSDGDSGAGWFQRETVNEVAQRVVVRALSGLVRVVG